jgi:hypothetical protein
MVALFLFLNLLISPFKPASWFEAEDAVLRHQLVVLQRKSRGRVLKAIRKNCLAFRFKGSKRLILSMWCF